MKMAGSDSRPTIRVLCGEAARQGLLPTHRGSWWLGKADGQERLNLLASAVFRAGPLD